MAWVEQLQVWYNCAMRQKHVLFLFVDGVGLGEDDPGRNPFCVARMPALTGLLGDCWYLQHERVVASRASLSPTDACLGVPGRPQSATGQAALLTGLNVPSLIGEHFGPKPNREIATLVQNGNLFARVRAAGGEAIFLNPYPPRYFAGVESGRRLLSVMPLAAQAAGLRLQRHSDLMAGRAVSPDFTGRGWRDRLNYPETPVLNLWEAGARLASLAQAHSLALLEHWPTDLTGHRQDMEQAVELLEQLDGVVQGVLDNWDWENGTVLITSDHGNVEDLGSRNHTTNPVPTIAIGRGHREMTASICNLTDVAPAALRALELG